MSVIINADSADRSESAVDESEPTTRMKNTPIANGGRNSDAICGIRLLLSPSSGVTPANSASSPSMPRPITTAP